MCNLSKGVMEKGIAKGIAKGRAEGQAEGMVQGILTSLKSLMDTMGLTIEQAMTALKIPESERQKYADLLNKQ